MFRRDWMKGLIGALTVGAFVSPAKAEDPIQQYGANAPSRRQRKAFQQLPTFYSRFAPFKGASSEGKNVFLFQNLQKEIGEIVPHWQGPAPEDGAQGEGDCVGQASAMGCDVLAATDIHDLGQREKFVAKASVEMIYAGSRVEIGGGQIRGRGGSHGEWAAQYLRDYGVLHRLKYAKGDDSIDLTGYHPGRSRKYRDAGVPDWLESIAKEHPVKEYTQPKSGQEALDAVCARQPVLMCSSYAFQDQRDAQGFCMPYLGGGKTRRGWRFVSARIQWWHAMILTGALLEGGRVGGLIQNSHGAWNSGPRPHDIPEGSFFVDLEYLDLMVKDWFDCWALGSYEGHQAAQMRHKLYRR